VTTYYSVAGHALLGTLKYGEAVYGSTAQHVKQHNARRVHQQSITPPTTTTLQTSNAKFTSSHINGSSSSSSDFY
jgi:hypothetical protein